MLENDEFMRKKLQSKGDTAKTKDSGIELLVEMKNDINKLMIYFALPSDNLKGAFSSQKAVKIIEKYILNYDRLLYSEITNYVIKLLKDNDDSVINDLIANLDNCFHYCLDKNNKVCDNTQKIILKLWDHINLANSQYLSFFQEESMLREHLYPGLDEKIITLNRDNEKIKKSSKNLKAQVEKATDDYKNITTNMISIVALFVGISFVMFGGMSLMSSLFGNLKEGSIPLIELICLGSLIGIIMASVMYGFILFMLRITERIEGKKSLYRNTFFITTLSLWTVLFITLALWYGKSC